MKNIRQKDAGSLNQIKPTITIPTAPIPVQTEYAVPIGNVKLARYSKNILRVHLKTPKILIMLIL